MKMFNLIFYDWELMCNFAANFKKGIYENQRYISCCNGIRRGYGDC